MMRQTLADEIVNAGYGLSPNTVIFKIKGLVSWSSQDSLGKLCKPVFENIIIEEEYKEGKYIEKTGVLISEVSLSLFICTFFMWDNLSKVVTAFPVQLYLDFNEAGELAKYNEAKIDMSGFFRRFGINPYGGMLDISDVVPSRLESMFLLHQKTEVELVTPSRQVSRQIERKTGKKPSPYFEIKVDPTKPQKRYTNSKKTGRKNNAHVVRGNFATYSEDAPLFGKYTGTIWRPSHVRGNGDNVSPKDYRIVLP